MSADAAPVVVEWMKENGYEYKGEIGYISEDYTWYYEVEEYADFYMGMIDEDSKDMGIRNFNVSRYRAKSLIGE